MNTETKRDAAGRYEAGLARVCAKCGHTLGEHNAERPYAQDDATFGFTCDGFKRVRK